MIRLTPPPKSRRRKHLEREMDSLRGVQSIAEELDRSRERISQLALRFDLGYVLPDSGSGIRVYWPEEVDFLREYITAYGRVPKDTDTAEEQPA